MSTTRTLTLLTLLFTLAIRHDVDESHYLEFGAQLPAVVQVSGFASGTVIAPQWVLTAAHVPEMMKRMNPDAPLFVSVGDARIEIAEVHVPAERAEDPAHHDIALLRLVSPVPGDIEPLALSREAPEVGQEVVVAGWGILSVADEGIELSPAAMASPTRARRAGWNTIDRYDEEAGVLYADLDGPGEGLDLEAGPCIGDSGGPALIRIEGGDGMPDTYYIAGVMALIDDTDKDRIVGEYGEEFGMTSVAGHLEWIEEMTSDPSHGSD